MTLRLRLLVLVVAGLGHSCGADPAVQQLVEEVRAARLQRRAESTSAPTVQATRDLVEATVAPVGELLATVSKAQQDLAGRQADLAAELQRWTQLVVTEVSADDVAMVAAMQQRLQSLEEAVVAARSRQDEVDGAVRDMLTRLSDQMADFLARLESLQDRRASQSGTVAEPSQALRENPTDRPSSLWPLWGVAFLAIGAGVWLMLPSTSARVGKWRSGTQAVPAGNAGAALSRDAAPPAAPGVEPGEPEVEQLWNTAAMLGEAIGRIRGAGGGEDLPDAAPPSAAPSDLAGVGPAENSSGAMPSASPRPAPSPGPGFPAGSVCWSLRARDGGAARERVLQLLGRDRRVLREPAPLVEVVDGGIDVAFALMPETPPGERALLEQKVREAAR